MYETHLAYFLTYNPSIKIRYNDSLAFYQWGVNCVLKKYTPIKKTTLNCEKRTVKCWTAWVGDTMVYPSKDSRQ